MILIVGLSPAWQRALEFDRLAIGEVNRAKRFTESAAGKGVNTARVAMQLGAPAVLLTVVGGARGELLADSLRRQGIDARMVRVGAETRVCQTLLVEGRATELVEEAGRLNREEVGTVLRHFAVQVRKASLVVLTGSVPPGCGDDFYSRLALEANRRGVPVLADAQGRQLLNLLRQKPFLVRITRHELAEAFGVAPTNQRACATAARRLVSRGACWLVVSDGAARVHLWPGGETFAPPRVASVNPIGSGDAMMAGIAQATLGDKDVREAVRLGIACGAANAMTPTAGTVRWADVRRLLARIGHAT